MCSILIVKTGTALPDIVERRGDFERWIADGMGVDLRSVRVVEVYRGEPLPEARRAGAVVVTGSAAMVTERAAWSVKTGEWLASAIQAGTPVLGICYGHQLIAQALGGRVGPNPRGREIGTVQMDLTAAGARDPLLGALPSAARVQATHAEAVLELPPGARLLATSALDPNQSYAAGPRAWCVQFHPEVDAQIMRSYIESRRDGIAAEGMDPDAILARTRDSDDGQTLLRRFAELTPGS